MDKRKGKIEINTHHFMNTDIAELSAIYSVVYPLLIERGSMNQINDRTTMYCISEHFSEVEEGCLIPEYELILEKVYSEEGSEYMFNASVKLKE